MTVVVMVWWGDWIWTNAVSTMINVLLALMPHFWWRLKSSSVFFVSASATSYAQSRRSPRSSAEKARDPIVWSVRTTVQTSLDAGITREWSHRSFQAIRYRRIYVVNVLDWLKFVEYVQVKSRRLTRRAWPRRASIELSRWWGLFTYFQAWTHDNEEITFIFIDRNRAMKIDGERFTEEHDIRLENGVCVSHRTFRAMWNCLLENVRFDCITLDTMKTTTARRSRKRTMTLNDTSNRTEMFQTINILRVVT